MSSYSYVLSVAGLDPSGGAGLLADIKTFHQFGVQGFGVCTALTAQNEHSVSMVEWMNWDQIKTQLDDLFAIYEIVCVKIGVIENVDKLNCLLLYLREKRSIKWIIWDPVITSSSGRKLIKGLNKQSLERALSLIDFITPNLLEFKEILKVLKFDAIDELLRLVDVILKGGHDEGNESIDILYRNGQLKVSLGYKRLDTKGKHGTGCVYSSAFSALLAKEVEVEKAFKSAKKYVYELLQTTENKLGAHHLIKEII